MVMSTACNPQIRITGCPVVFNKIPGLANSWVQFLALSCLRTSNGLINSFNLQASTSLHMSCSKSTVLEEFELREQSKCLNFIIQEEQWNFFSPYWEEDTHQLNLLLLVWLLCYYIIIQKLAFPSLFFIPKQVNNNFPEIANSQQTFTTNLVRNNP